MKTVLLIAVCGVALVVAPVSATIINVPGDYSTIQAGINASTDGDTVLVQPGRYFENINFNGHNIVLGSLFLITGETHYRSTSIIDGNYSGTVVSFKSGEDTTTMLNGFTLQHGYGYSGYFGAAIACSSSSPKIYNNIMQDNEGRNGTIGCRSSDPIISSNVIRGNTVQYQGGGIWCYLSNVVIVGNEISNNSAEVGGGIYFAVGEASVNGNSIIGNIAESGTGGFKCYMSTVTIRDNVISGNRGSGISCDQSYITIEGNLISNNDPTLPFYSYGGGISFWRTYGGIFGNIINGNIAEHGGGIWCQEYSNPVVAGNEIFDNVSNQSGGGMACRDYSSPFVVANTFFNNTCTGYGGAMNFSDHCSPVLCNNTIYRNIADSTGGGISCRDISNAQIVNSIFWSDSAEIGNELFVDGTSSIDITYSDVQGGWEGIGNIDINPLFCEPDSNDFHLQSLTNPNCGDPQDSPCIDAGHPDTLDHIMGCESGLGTIRSDMGAYGGYNANWTKIREENGDEVLIPEDFALYQNYPNPFNASTVLRYSLPQVGEVSLVVYNVLGRKVGTVFEGVKQAGTHSAMWDGGDVSSGIYFAVLSSGRRSETIKMLLMK